jgi:hypothetical protein
MTQKKADGFATILVDGVKKLMNVDDGHVWVDKLQIAAEKLTTKPALGYQKRVLLPGVMQFVSGYGTWQWLDKAGKMTSKI